MFAHFTKNKHNKLVGLQLIFKMHEFGYPFVQLYIEMEKKYRVKSTLECLE